MPRSKRSRDPSRITCRFDRRDLILRFWQVVPSTLGAVNRVIRRILRVARAMECAKGELDKVELALQEALTNAIRHGSGGNSREKVSVCCFCTADKGIVLVVTDQGSGFDPSQVPDPTTAERIYAAHGRGIFLMKQLMDTVRFRQGGREVVMTKASPRNRGAQMVSELRRPRPARR